MPSFRLLIRENDNILRSADLDGPLELGRQRQDELAHELYALLPSASGPARLLVARQSEGNVSRQHVLLEPLPSGAVHVSNRSQIPLPLGDGTALPPGSGRELAPPFHLLLPPRSVEVFLCEATDEHGCQSLAQPSLGPGAMTGTAPASTLSAAFPPAGRELLDWLHATMSVLQSSLGSADFLDRAAEALVRIVGLDSGRVLLRDGDHWTVGVAHGVAPLGHGLETGPNKSGLETGPNKSWRPSKHVLERLVRERRAVWQRPQQATVPLTPTPLPQGARGEEGGSASLLGLDAVVAAPLLDAQGNVIGALYGERRRDSPAPAQADGKLEAMLVDLLACGVSTGLARQEQEKAAVKATALFEQFFTRQLAQTLARHPDLLDGRKADVAVLFCDVRGFSSASERLGPAKTFQWINDVMGDFSACVQAECGVLVDYIGDELMAMWGVPEPQPDQAARAIRAGLAMLDALAPLNERWRTELGKDMAIGIGVNSGPAQVGNTGSRFKFKYGPLGNTVNLASRVQGLTKYLRCRFLITRSTREQLGDDFIARRVVRARVVNIEEPVDLYEVERATTTDRDVFFRSAEAALDALEARNFAAAARAAGELLPQHRGDGPLLLTLSRASAALMNDGADFDPVWAPPGK